VGIGTVRRIVRIGVVAAIVATGVVWESNGAHAADFPDSNPTRLYMAPDGTTLFASLVGVPIATLEFGPGPDDLISGDTRDITVDVDPGPLGCDTTTDDPPLYDLDDCPRLQLDVLHGRLELETAEQLFRNGNPNDVVWRLPGGAVVSQIGGGGNPDTPNDPDGHTGYHLSGLEAQINAALDGMSYVPDDGYYYTDTAPEERLNMLLVSGDPSVSSAGHVVEIRVLDVNDAASLEGPSSAVAQPEVELFLPEGPVPLSWPYAGSLWTVADEDNDEVVDDDTGETLPDGAGDKMLLVGYLDCGVPTVDDETGFRLRGGSFEADDADIEDLLTDFYDLTTAPPEVQTAVDGLLDALNLIEPGLTNLPLATSDPFIYNDIFAGIGDIDDVAYALSQVRFLSNAENDTCTLYTVVSDLGNNGLPLQYIGDPPTGVEVPFLGVPPIDVVETEITVGGLEEIEVNFDPATQFVLEATTATATIVIDPPTHPAFDLRWSAVSGTATAGDDFQGVTDATITVPEDAASVQIDTNVFDDLDPEGNETFLFTLTVPTDPPDSPSGFVRPFGYEVVSTQSTQTVTILDDDDADAQITSFGNASVTEGDAGTTTMTFTVGLDKPADGDESVDVSDTPGSATNPDDYGDPAPATVTFAPGASSATIDVPVYGDVLDEGDHSFTLTLSNPANVTIVDATATGTILDDDEMRTASIADASVLEGDAGTTDLVFTISLDQPAKGTESLDVTTADGSATAPSDYAALTDEPVTFAPGQTSAQVAVTVAGDTDVELDETLTVSLGSAVNVDIGTGTATGTITNDDGVIGVSVNDVTVTEGNAGTTNATFTVSLDEAPTGTESIRVATSDDTATVADGDYDAATQDITFTGPGLTATFTVLVNGDTDVEPDETFEVELSMPVGLVILDGTGVGTITNDDAPPVDPSVISIADAFVSEGGGSNEAIISMTNPAGVECRVLVTSSDGSATAPSDYAALVAYPVDLNNTGSVSLPLTIVDDLDPESGEDFNVEITLAGTSDPSCEIGDGTAQVYIAASDGGANTPPFVTIDQAAGQADPTTTSPILFAVEFSEPVTGFDAADVSFSGSTTDATLTPTVTGGPQSYTVSVAAAGATSTGTVVASIPAGAASDGAAPSFASTSTDNTVTLVVDTTAPTVTVNQAAGQADPTSVSPILFTVVFSEPVVGFATGDVSLGGSAGATTAVVSDTGDSTTFDVAVSGMTQDGTVVASIGAGAATDAASNPSVASTSTDNTVTFDLDEGSGPPDTTAPTVTVNQAAGQADPTDATPVLFTVVFSEPVTGFAPSDLVLAGTAGATTATVSGAGTTYTVSVSGMPGPGTVIVTIPGGAAVDAALNPSVASTSTDNVVTYEPDVTAPITLDLPDDMTVPNDPGQAGAVVTFAAATASGGVPPLTVTCDRTSGAFFPLGTTTVSCTATDAAASQPTDRFVEATATGSFTITVVDTEPPAITTPPNLVRTATSSSGTAVTYTAPIATDNAGTPAVTCAPASGTVFRLGVSTVTCTATDATGNTARSTFTVTVTAPSTGVPATGSDTMATLLVAMVLVAVGLATRRVGRRTFTSTG
jgi:large repetitive protein